MTTDGSEMDDEMDENAGNEAFDDEDDLDEESDLDEEEEDDLDEDDDFDDEEDADDDDEEDDDLDEEDDDDLDEADDDGYESGDVNAVSASEYEAGDVNTIGPGAHAPRHARAEAPESGGGTPVAVLTYLAQSMADDPEAVVIRQEERRGSTVLRLHVAPSDMGRVIGRRGRTAQAIRTLVTAAGARDGVQVAVDIVDD